MDPNANFREQRDLIANINRANDSGLGADANDVSRLTELVEALDVWLTRGGFLPSDWYDAQS